MPSLKDAMSKVRSYVTTIREITLIDHALAISASVVHAMPRGLRNSCRFALDAR